ncbi:MAG: hypothetical protein HT579_18800 [Candidatus Accumulibacter similis]|nr:MAG: hypothetical protein HT579_18800 [Candidatus Accumulibacter similis]
MAVAEREVKAFDQRSVFSKFSDIPYSELQNASMAREGYVFIPKSCTDGRKCRLHVAFHGCLQGGLTDRRSGQSGNLFAKFAGYNKWAQANDIVVYPQVQVRNGTLASPPVNPQGCWDWWGQYHTHTGYHTQAGKQIRAVAQMTARLLANASCCRCWPGEAGAPAGMRARTAAAGDESAAALWTVT